MAKKKGTNLSDKEIKKLREKLGDSDGYKTQAFDAARQARMEKGLMAAIKAFGETSKKERIATKGLKTGRGDFFRGAGFEELGNLVEMMFDKKATKEEQQQAKQELGIKDKKKDVGGGSGISISSSKQLLRRFKFIETSIADISEDIKYIKDRVSPKVLNTKEEGGKGKKQVIFDPLGPHGDQFRQVNQTKTGHLTSKVGAAHIKSATTQAANIGANTLKKSASTKVPKATGAIGPKKGAASSMTGKMSKAAAPAMAAKPKFTDPAEKSPFDDDISKALSAGNDPIAKMHKEMTASFNKLFAKVGDTQDDSKDMLDLLGQFSGPIFKALGPMAAVGAAAFIGYQVGTWLNDTFKLDEKISGFVDKVAGLFGKSTEDKARESADKASSDLMAKRNAGLQGTGWKYVVKAGVGSASSEIYFLDPQGNKVKVKEAPEDIKQKAGIPAAKPAEAATPPSAPPTPTPTAPPAAAATPSPAAAPTSAPPSKPAGGSTTPPPPPPPKTSGKLASSGGTDAATKNMIKRHEGVRYKPYKDSLGLWTVGVGHLIGDGKTLPPEYNREFSAEEVDQLFNKDFDHHQDAAEKIPGYNKLNEAGQGALTDLTFNMGPTWYKKWPTFTKQVASGDVEGAASNLESSKWASQVGNRAPEVVSLLRSGSSENGGGVLASNSNGNDRSSMVAEGTTPSASGVTPSTMTAGAPRGSVTPSGSYSGAALDNGSKQVSAGKEAAARSPAPIVMASTTTPASASKTPPQAVPSANPRSSEGSFNRALAKDYSHPTAFTTVGTV